ncbi:MAG: hypothetical protein KJI72_03510 [Patescibacteria group bacterium]|nr:hypothetical protein [Patescibacteria group bacterium]
MFFGHEDKIKTFKKLVRDDDLSHAYLFYGYPQIGKFYFSRLLAFFLESGEFEITDKPLIDARIFSPGENKVIGVETVRELKRFLFQKPLKSSRRLAIINNANMLSREAESSMLKIVEEPPPAAMIIFIVHDQQTLFTPLLSRLTSVYFSSFRENKIEEILAKNYKLSANKAAEVAKKSFGRIGRAINLIEGTKELLTEDDLKSEIEDRIINLYIKGVRQNSHLLAQLLNREVTLWRFNLNTNLQRKAVNSLVSGK